MGFYAFGEMEMNSKKLLWGIYRIGEQLGPVGWTLLASCFLGLILASFLWAPTYFKWKALAHPQARLSTQEALPSRERDITQFLAHFPLAKARSHDIQMLMDGSEALGLTLNQVSYKMEESQEDHLAHYHIDFMVTASYPVLSDFISKTLIDLPNLSMDRLTFSRKSVSDEAIDAHIRMTLHAIK
jgi:hypothetical protein